MIFKVAHVSVLESISFSDVIPRGMIELRGLVLRESAVHLPASRVELLSRMIDSIADDCDGGDRGLAGGAKSK